MQSARPGFTLIELMVVVSIIAVLAAVGLVLYQQAQKAGRDGKRIGDMQEVQKALEQYYAANGTYPAAAAYSNLTTYIATYFASGSVPADPGANTYTYSRNASCTGGLDKYVVCAKVELISKANSDTAATDACASLTKSATSEYYCAKSLAN
ncbi:type II secretion system protein [Candidatus Daviesbacteria bacterium]|nr:type II secretion system protein [Candidatus Daviesbacteria bacterium]